MGRTAKQPAISEAVLLQIELYQTVTRSDSIWTVAVSRPGRDGQFERKWHSPTGVLEPESAQDLSTYVQRIVQDALVVWGSVRGVPAR